jgi:hypothetical protein
VRNEFLAKFDALVILSAISNDPMGNMFEEVSNSINHLAVNKIIVPYVGSSSKQKISVRLKLKHLWCFRRRTKNKFDILNPLTA